MYGAIIGDIVGSTYEFCNKKTKSFQFLGDASFHTDISVMTIGVADGLTKGIEEKSIDNERKAKIYIGSSMHRFESKYPNLGYAEAFRRWRTHNEKEPYNSWGNHLAVRAIPTGWLYEDIDTTRRIARWIVEEVNYSPEGVKGAEATASAIFLARCKKNKNEIKEYIEKEFGYNLEREIDEIRQNYSLELSCQGTVPEAIISFLQSTSFKDAIRNAVSLGGDSVSIAAIAGAVAEAYYGFPQSFMPTIQKKLPDDMLAVIEKFNSFRKDSNNPKNHQGIDFEKLINPHMTIDNYVVGDFNRHAYAAGVAVMEAPGKKYNPLFIFGESGQGKSHLMQAIAGQIATNDPSAKIIYISVEMFANELCDFLRADKSNSFRKKYRQADALLIDNFDFIEDKPTTQKEILFTIETIMQNGGQVIIAADKTPHKMSGMNENLASILKGSMIVSINRPSIEERIAILESISESLHIKPSPASRETIKYIAQNVSENIRELEGALKREKAFADLENREISVDSARRALASLYETAEIPTEEKKTVVDKLRRIFIKRG